MNSVEAIVASKLTERRVAWEYELPIHTDKKTYLPDFTINKNIIIEVFGDFWHATPKVYDSSDIIYSKITAGEIWARDANKKEVLEKLGYRVYILWQDDIINSPHILEELINGIC
jgi:G:T-mismatch repair DNA endonuclease (very short patch repair protein)